MIDSYVRRRWMAYLRSTGEVSKDYKARAMAAYFRSCCDGAPMPAQGGDIIEHSGRSYVRLSNVNGTLAVYRILEKQDSLKRLKRWPKEVAA